MKIFTKTISNCGECPNRFDDEEEHADFCQMKTEIHCNFWDIPVGCPLEDFEEGVYEND